MYTSASVYMCIHAHLRVTGKNHIAYMEMYMFICIRVHMYICIYIHTCESRARIISCMWNCICVYVYEYISMYVYTYTPASHGQESYRVYRDNPAFPARAVQTSQNTPLSETTPATSSAQYRNSQKSAS